MWLRWIDIAGPQKQTKPETKNKPQIKMSFPRSTTLLLKALLPCSRTLNSAGSRLRFHSNCQSLLCSVLLSPLLVLFFAQVFWLNCSPSVATTIKAIAGELFVPISGLHQVPVCDCAVCLYFVCLCILCVLCLCVGDRGPSWSTLSVVVCVNNWHVVFFVPLEVSQTVTIAQVREDEWDGEGKTLLENGVEKV